MKPIWFSNPNFKANAKSKSKVLFFKKATNLVPKTPSGGMKNNHDHKQKHMIHCITVTVTAALCSFPKTKHF